MFKALKNISLYSFGEVLNKSVQFLLLPLYTHYLSPADYGKLELTYLYAGILVIFYGFIIENGYARLYFDKDDAVYHNKLFGTSFFFKFITGAVFLIASILFAEDFAEHLFSFENGSIYIILVSVSTYIKSLSEIPLKTIIIEKRVKRYVLNNFVYLILSILSTIYFITVLNLNVLGVLYGQIIGGSIQLITLLISEWKSNFFVFSYELLKGMFHFSLFIIPSQLASFVTYWSNRLFLQEHTSLDDIGKFSFGYKIASIISILLTGPIKKAVGPEIYSLINNPEECRSKLRQYTLITLLTLTLSSLTLSVFSKELIALMASKGYEDSHQYVFILCMGYVIIGIAGIVVLSINITKKTWIITLTWLLSSAVNLILNYLLIKTHGAAGATYATLLTFVFITTLYFIFSERVYNVGFEYKKYFFILAVSTISYYVATQADFRFIVYNILLKTLVLALTYLILYYSLFSKEMRDKFILALVSKIAPSIKEKNTDPQ